MNNDSTKGYSIKDVIDLLIRRIWFIIILTIAGGGIAFSYSHFVMPLEYESHISMYVKNNNSSSAEKKEGVNMNDLYASKSLVSTYIAVLEDDTVMEELGKQLIREYGIQRISDMFTVEYEDNVPLVKPSSLKSMITMESVDETEVLKITAITTDAEISAGICNKLSEIAPEFLIRVVGAGSVEKIGSARLNNNPVAPNVKKYTLLGIAAGLMMSCGIVFAIEFFDNTVKDPEQLTKRYDKAIIGEIHCIRKNNKNNHKRRNKNKKKTDSKYLNLLINKETPYYVVEAYKVMRTNLIYSLSTSDNKIFAVSSANPGDGKSLTSANIAIALSQLSNKVILIDADMRKPVQHKIFKTKNNTGLSNVLGKMSKINDCICPSGVTDLDIMTAGPQPPNPSELLSSSQMEKLIAVLSEKYDYIIIDTPPINLVTDAMSIGKYLSGILLVISYGSTRSNEVEDMVKKIGFAEINMLGFVLNNVDKKYSAGTYYHRYAKYYSPESDC